MQIKKSPKADLQNMKGLFLEIGLIVSLLITIGAFLYAPKEYRIEQVDLNYAPIEEEITDHLLYHQHQALSLEHQHGWKTVLTF